MDVVRLALGLIPAGIPIIHRHLRDNFLMLIQELEAVKHSRIGDDAIAGALGPRAGASPFLQEGSLGVRAEGVGISLNLPSGTYFLLCNADVLRALLDAGEFFLNGCPIVAILILRQAIIWKCTIILPIILMGSKMNNTIVKFGFLSNTNSSLNRH